MTVEKCNNRHEFQCFQSKGKQHCLVGLRVNQVYDIDNKTYLIRFQDKDVKTVLLLESGFRFHTTDFEWPKNVAPSGFTMKLRKHLKNKRLEKLEQLSLDRIISLQFGIGEAAYHVIVELYDRGNIILTDHQKIILNILRPHTEGEEVRFAVREKYPESRAKEITAPETLEQLEIILRSAQPGDYLKRILNPLLAYGSSLIEHVLSKHDLLEVKLPEPVTENAKPAKGKGKNTETFKRIFDFSSDVQLLMNAINEANDIIQNASSNKHKGVIIQKRELKPSQDDQEKEYFHHNIEYHPFLFHQHKDMPYKEFDSFDMAVDEFYSTLEGQKIDVKAPQQERDALKKLSNVKRDDEKRLEDLSKIQIEDKVDRILKDRCQSEFIIRHSLIIDEIIAFLQSTRDLKVLNVKMDVSQSGLIIKNIDFKTNEMIISNKVGEVEVCINLELSAAFNAEYYRTSVEKRSALHQRSKQRYDADETFDWSFSEENRPSEAVSFFDKVKAAFGTSIIKLIESFGAPTEHPKKKFD